MNFKTKEAGITDHDCRIPKENDGLTIFDAIEKNLKNHNENIMRLYHYGGYCLGV